MVNINNEVIVDTVAGHGVFTESLEVDRGTIKGVVVWVSKHQTGPRLCDADRTAGAWGCRGDVARVTVQWRTLLGQTFHVPTHTPTLCAVIHPPSVSYLVNGPLILTRYRGQVLTPGAAFPRGLDESLLLFTHYCFTSNHTTKHIPSPTLTADTGVTVPVPAGTFLIPSVYLKVVASWTGRAALPRGFDSDRLRAADRGARVIGAHPVLLSPTFTLEASIARFGSEDLSYV